MGKAFKLRNGMLLLSTEAPGGLYNSAQLQKIASLVGKDAALVKATEDQRLAIFVKPERVKHMADELKAVGIGLRNFQDGIHQPTACLGKHCPEFQQDALTTAIDLSEELADLTTSTPLRLGINGCARCCVPCHTLDISIVGDSMGYRISLGGKNSQLPEIASFMAESVPADKVAALIGKVVRVYQELSENDETLQETIERAGPSRFIEVLAPYSQDAAGGGDDPFGHLEANEDEASGPTVEHEHEVLAFDNEPAVESFEDEASLDDSVMAFDEPLSEASDEQMAELVSSSTHDDDDAELTDDLVIEGSDAETTAENLIPEQALASDVEQDSTTSDTVSNSGVDPASSAVLAAPASLASSVVPKTSAVADSDGNDALGLADGIEEVEGEAADAFEEKLNASIAEEESMPVLEDVNSNSRLEAMRMVETGGNVHAGLQVEGGFENLGIDMYEPSEETFTETNDNGELDPTAAEAVQPTPLAEESGPGANNHGRLAHHSDGSFELVAIEFTPEGRLHLQFSTGAAVIVDPKTIRPGSSRELLVSGKKLKIHAEDLGISV